MYQSPVFIELDLEEVETVSAMGADGHDSEVDAVVVGEDGVEVPPLERVVVGDIVGGVIRDDVLWEVDVFCVGVWCDGGGEDGEEDQAGGYLVDSGWRHGFPCFYHGREII